MAELRRSDTVTKAIVAAQEEAATVPLREDDNDDETIRGIVMDYESPSATANDIDTSIFDVFSDFNLDLCLSAPSSPVQSTSELPPTTPSPPASPILSRAFSFTSQKAAAAKKLTSKKASSPQLTSSTAPAGTRGSWPLIKYTGRGTPIDRSRRMEWAGAAGEEVAEDGVLFSTVRSTSLDSAARPSTRSLSPEWNYLSHLSSSLSHSNHSDPTSSRAPSLREPPPELGPLQMDTLSSNKADEWDSIMKTVLGSTNLPLQPVQPELPEAPELTTPISDTGATEEAAPAPAPIDFSTMSKEQVEQLNTGLESDLGLNAALDLGLGQRGGMNWFDLGLLPSSGASGRDSPSVYSSQAATPRERSPAPSEHASEHRSTTSTKADATGGTGVVDTIKIDSRPWWKRMCNRLRRVQTLITIPMPKNRF